MRIVIKRNKLIRCTRPVLAFRRHALLKAEAVEQAQPLWSPSANCRAGSVSPIRTEGIHQSQFAISRVFCRTGQLH